MTDNNQRALAETIFERQQERQVSEALKIEAARHAAAIQNMQRLRALRLAGEVRANNE
jgi:hypothetical protein